MMEREDVALLVRYMLLVRCEQWTDNNYSSERIALGVEDKLMLAFWEGRCIRNMLRNRTLTS